MSQQALQIECVCPLKIIIVGWLLLAYHVFLCFFAIARDDNKLSNFGFDFHFYKKKKKKTKQIVVHFTIYNGTVSANWWRRKSVLIFRNGKQLKSLQIEALSMLLCDNFHLFSIIHWLAFAFFVCVAFHLFTSLIIRRIACCFKNIRRCEAKNHTEKIIESIEEANENNCNGKGWEWARCFFFFSILLLVDTHFRVTDNKTIETRSIRGKLNYSVDKCRQTSAEPNGVQAIVDASWNTGYYP